jgi:hypothetical protein
VLNNRGSVEHMTETHTTALTTLIQDPDTGIDARTAFQHLNYGDSWRLTRLGAHDRLYDETAGYIQFDVELTKKLRVVVKLQSDDSYAVEIGRIKLGKEYTVLEQHRGIYYDQLGELVERMVVVWS